MNQLEITGTVLETKPLRYTPAGLAVIEMLLDHESQVQQANHMRRVNLTLTAIAMGDTALMLANVVLGTQLCLKGFLAASRKGSSRLVLHIQHASQLPQQATALV